MRSDTSDWVAPYSYLGGMYMKYSYVIIVGNVYEPTGAMTQIMHLDSIDDLHIEDVIPCM